MPSLYDEIIASAMGKQASLNTGSQVKEASQTEDIKDVLRNFSPEKLVSLAAELDKMASSDLADMAKQLPVFATKAVEEGLDAEDAVKEASEKEVAEAPIKEKEEAQIAEAVLKENTQPTDMDVEVSEGEVAEAMAEVVEEKEASPSEILYAILKEGAALEELIEVRAAQMVDELIKEAQEESSMSKSASGILGELSKIAEDVTVARKIVEDLAVALGLSGARQHEFVEMVMEKVRTISAQTAESMVDVAAKVVSVVAEESGAELDEVEEINDAVEDAAEKVADVTIEDLAKYAQALEEEFVKVAEVSAQYAQQLLAAAGMEAGLSEADLYEFVARGMDKVRTIAAQSSRTLPEVVQEMVAGLQPTETLAAGYSAPAAPAPSVQKAVETLQKAEVAVEKEAAIGTAVRGLAGKAKTLAEPVMTKATNLGGRGLDVVKKNQFASGAVAGVLGTRAIDAGVDRLTSKEVKTANEDVTKQLIKQALFG